MGLGGQHHAPAALPLEIDPVPTVQEAEWAPGPVWKSVENLATHRDSIPGPSSPWLVAVPTELSRPTIVVNEANWIVNFVWGLSFVILASR